MCTRIKHKSAHLVLSSYYDSRLTLESHSSYDDYQMSPVQLHLLLLLRHHYHHYNVFAREWPWLNTAQMSIHSQGVCSGSAGLFCYCKHLHNR